MSSYFPHVDPTLGAFIEDFSHQIIELRFLWIRTELGFIVSNCLKQVKNPSVLERKTTESKTVKGDTHRPNIDSFTRDFSVFGDAELGWDEGGRACGFRCHHFRAFVKHLGHPKIHNF